MIEYNYSPRDVTFMDVETQSAANIKGVGSKQYIRDPSTRLLSAVFKRGKDVVVWIPERRAPSGVPIPENTLLHIGNDVPPVVRKWIDEGTTFVAHNAESFDASFWERHVRINVPWFDTIHLCRLHGLPASLDGASKAIGGKGKADDEAMLLLTNAKVNKKSGAVIYPIGTDRLWFALLKYNIDDVLELERIYNYVSSLPIPQSEREMIDLNWRINSRGVYIDLPFARRLRDAWAKSKLESVDELVTLTGGKLNKDNIGSPKQVKEYLSSIGLKVDSLDKRIVNQILENPEQFIEDHESDDAELALAVLVERQNAVRSTIGKIDRLFKVVDEDATVRQCIVYHGAHTGRFSGRDLQPHNFPRGLQFSSDSKTAKRLLRESLEKEDLLSFAKETAETLQSENKTKKDRREATVANVLATLTRCFIRARPGRKFAIADYAAVEARGVAHFARAENMLEQFGDPKKDIYLDMASKLFGRICTKKDKDERFIGKQIVLGCGYQMAAPKFGAGCKVYLVDLEAAGTTPEECVLAYRKGYPDIPAVWREYHNAIHHCVGTGHTLNAGRCTFQMDGSYLCILLPSGRTLRYRNAAIEMLPPKWAPSGDKIAQVTFQSPYGYRKSLYGGLVTENIVQAACRDLLRDAMREISALYDVVMHVHDEIIIEAPENVVEQALHDLCRIMSNPPKWANNFPIRVEGFTNSSYTKSAVDTSYTADYMKGLAI